MKLPAMVLAMALGSVPVFAQALIEYGGAMAPAATFAARPANPAVHIHHSQIIPTETAGKHSGAHCKRAQQTAAECPRRGKDGKFVPQARTREHPLAAQEKPEEKKISDPGAVAIQR